MTREKNGPYYTPLPEVNTFRSGGGGIDWRHQSACLTEDPELFFPIGNYGPALNQIEEAKAVCQGCDVRQQCLTWALESGQDHGVWGGMSEDERKALKRRKVRTAIVNRQTSPGEGA